MIGVSRQRIPSLILVDVVDVYVGHGINTGTTGVVAFHECATPAAGVHPCGVVVANAPHNTATTCFDLFEVATNLTPIHVAHRNDGL